MELGRAEADQVGVAEALRVELPAGGEQATDLFGGERPLRRRRPLSWMFFIANPAELAQHGQRLRVLGAVAVCRT